MNFRENLREALDFSGLQQKELAYKAKISKRNIENYLRKGGSIPTADNAVKIAHVLGVTVEYLVTGKNSQVDIYSSMEPEMRQFIRTIRSLPAKKQRIVIKNGLYLAGII